MDERETEHWVEEITRRVCARLRGTTNGQPGTNALPNTTAAEGVGGKFTDSSPASDLARYIDHTLLRPDATQADLHKVCDEAWRYGFASVCVNAGNVRFCVEQLAGSNVMIVSVVGFPLGAQTATAKSCEAREAVSNGAYEIDMVLNLGALKGRDYTTVFTDIRMVVDAAAPRPIKVILETGALNRDQKVIACALAKLAGAAFVKTSTGFGPGGATVEDVALMREIVGTEMGVKASGGIRTEADARKMIAAGATRIGASASVAIVGGSA